MIEGDLERPRGQNRRIVTDDSSTGLAAEPIDQAVLVPGHTVAGCGCSLATSTGSPAGVTSGCRSSGSSSASFSTSSM